MDSRGKGAAFEEDGMRWRNRKGHNSSNLPKAASLSGDNCGQLTRLRPGSKAEVCSVTTGCKARYRLASLGLIPGSVLQVVANAGIGPLLLSVGESRLMVERGVAEKVQVQVI